MCDMGVCVLSLIFVCTISIENRRMVFKCVHRANLGVSFCASSQSLQWEEGRERGQVAWSIYLQSERKERLPLLAGGRRVVLINQHDRARILKSDLTCALSTGHSNSQHLIVIFQSRCRSRFKSDGKSVLDHRPRPRHGHGVGGCGPCLEYQ